MHGRTTRVLLVACLVVLIPALARGQLRIAQWNITNYTSGDRTADFRTCFYGVNPANALSMRPDIIIVQEMLQGSFPPAGTQATGQANVNGFLSMLNGAPGSPGDWVAATYVLNGGDTGNALFYRTPRIQLIATATQNASTGGSGPPRDTQRWRVRLVGYSAPIGNVAAPAEIYIYGNHMKAGSTTDDQNRRQVEALRLRTGTFGTDSLPAGSNFIFAGDFNIQSSNQTAYQTMTTTGSNSSGRLFDPINSPGAWNSNPTAYRYILTQEQTSNMDDRLDFILVSSSFRSGQGLGYLPAIVGGDIFSAYSTTTWNDPNHSYRSWGNDGSRVNLSIATTTNAMVGQAIAQALINSAAGNGHLPVFMDVRIPSRMGATPATIDFGTVSQGASATFSLQISNTTDTVLWNTSGRSDAIDPLTYSFTPSSGFGAPVGTFNLAPGAPAASHTISLDTSTSGIKSGTLTITSDDGNGQTRVISLVGTVIGGPVPDYDVNDDGRVDAEDIYAWLLTPTDTNSDSITDAQDLVDLTAAVRASEIAGMVTGRR